MEPEGLPTEALEDRPDVDAEPQRVRTGQDEQHATAHERVIPRRQIRAAGLAGGECHSAPCPDGEEQEPDQQHTPGSDRCTVVGDESRTDENQRDRPHAVVHGHGKERATGDEPGQRGQSEEHGDEDEGADPVGDVGHRRPRTISRRRKSDTDAWTRSRRKFSTTKSRAAAPRPSARRGSSITRCSAPAS